MNAIWNRHRQELAAQKAEKQRTAEKSEAVSTKRQARQQAKAVKEQTFDCIHRGDVVGNLDCKCSGKSSLNACAIFGMCSIHGHRKPFPLKFIPLSGDSYMMTEKPQVCIVCDKRESPVAEVAVENPFPVALASAETILFRTTLCGDCGYREKCQVPKAILDYAATQCPVGKFSAQRLVAAEQSVLPVTSEKSVKSPK